MAGRSFSIRPRSNEPPRAVHPNARAADEIDRLVISIELAKSHELAAARSMLRAFIGTGRRTLVAGRLDLDTAILDYVVAGNHQIERKAEEFFGGVGLSVSRPGAPKEAKADQPTSPGAR